MPNRIVREGILTSERIAALVKAGGWEAEVFYRRLMSIVDDYGRFTAQVAVLRAQMYPLQLEQMREANVSRCLDQCQAAGLVRLYSVSGKQYLQLEDFRQQVRSKHAKYPPPPGEASAQHMLRTCAADDQQAHDTCDASAHLGGGGGGGGGEGASPLNPPPTGEHNHHALPPLFNLAWEAFSRWQNVSEGYPLPIGRDHERRVIRLLNALEEQPPVLQGGQPVPQAALIPLAVDVLMKRGVKFTSVPYATKAVMGELDKWARHGLPGEAGGGEGAKVDLEAQTQRVLAKIAAEDAARGGVR